MHLFLLTSANIAVSYIATNSIQTVSEGHAIDCHRHHSQTDAQMLLLLRTVAKLVQGGRDPSRKRVSFITVVVAQESTTKFKIYLIQLN